MRFVGTDTDSPPSATSSATDTPPRLLQSLPNITTTITTQRPIDRRKHTTGLFEHQLGERVEASPNMKKTRNEEDNDDNDDEDSNTDDSKIAGMKERKRLHSV